MQNPEVGEDVEWHGIGEKGDYSIRQEQSDKKIWLTLSEQK
jgi:hypothetical protein